MPATTTKPKVPASKVPRSKVPGSKVPGSKVPGSKFTVRTHTLANGLRVVLAPDKAASSVAVVVVYDVGFRSEPEGMTGFAHLFEHLMFEGSASLGKMEHARHVQANGGVMNGQTTPDLTIYHEQLPPNALELGLFLEADRMRSVRLDDENVRNQIDVVKEEIKVNVMNQPFGGFPWIHLPPLVFSTYQNAHNGYGSFVDLESATVGQAADFFSRYYAPGNAVLTLAGAFKPAEALALIERHFGDIPPGPVPPRPSFAEPRPEGVNRGVHLDAFAPFPALAVGYRVPDPIEAYDELLAASLALDVLTYGSASRLHQRLVVHERSAVEVGGQMGVFGDLFQQRDPISAQVLAFHPGAEADTVLDSIDEEVAILAAGLTEEELAPFVMANVAGFLRRFDDLTDRAVLLSALHLLRGDPSIVNDLTRHIAAVGADAVAAAAGTWFTPSSRAILEVRPAGAS